MTNFCPNCGAAVESTALYCVRCGTPLTENANAAVDWENPYSAPSTAPSGFAAENDDPNAPEIPGFFRAFVVCLKKYASCRGRASRSEFWYFQLASFLLIVCVGAVVGGCIGAANPGRNATELSALINPIVVPLGNAMRLFFFLPSLAVCCRRLQDCDRSSWRLLWFSIPFFGAIASFLVGGSYGAYGTTVFAVVGLILSFFLIVRLGTEGTPGPNRFGPAPRRRAK